jgi:hypothetical protein
MEDTRFLLAAMDEVTEFREAVEEWGSNFWVTVMLESFRTG